MFERTSDAIRYLCETTYHICQSGVMSTTLQHNTCEETVHMSFWCDANHITTIPVKIQPTCYSGVMPPTLQQYLWRNTPHVTQVWCHPHYIPVMKQPTCHSGVMTPTLQQYLWRNNPHVTQVWCHPHYIPVKKQPTCHSGVMPTTLQTTCEETIHMSLALVWRHPHYNNTCEETLHKSPRCDALDSEYQQPRKIYHLLLCVKTLLQSRRHRHNIFCVINPHNTSERRIYIFVMFRALNVTLTETYTFIKAWRLQGRCNRHNLCDINSQNTTTWEGTIHMLLLWCSVRQTLHHQKHIPSFLWV